MNHGTQLSPAESAAMCGTELLAGVPVLVFVLAPVGVAFAWLLFCEAFEPPCEDPPPFPPEAVEALPVSEPLVWVLDEELGATGMVDCALELDELGLPPPLPPPTPGSADPYWSWEGDEAPAVGARTARKSAITETAIASRGVWNSLSCAPSI
jgi:hypothetical protein